MHLVRISRWVPRELCSSTPCRGEARRDELLSSSCFICCIYLSHVKQMDDLHYHSLRSLLTITFHMFIWVTTSIAYFVVTVVLRTWIGFARKLLQWFSEWFVLCIGHTLSELTSVFLTLIGCLSVSIHFVCMLYGSLATTWLTPNDESKYAYKDE